MNTEPIAVKDALKLVEMAIEDCDKATPGEWPSRPIMRVQAGTIAEFPPPSKTGLFALMDNVNFVVLSRAVMRPLIVNLKEQISIYVSGAFEPGSRYFEPLAALRDHYDRVRPDWRVSK